VLILENAGGAAYKDLQRQRFRHNSALPPQAGMKVKEMIVTGETGCSGRITDMEGCLSGFIWMLGEQEGAYRNEQTA
jgi:hypothetical protein